MNADQKRAYARLGAELDGPQPPVNCVGDLSARHLGKRITIRDLHQPGEDWNAPRVSVSGTLDGITRPGIGPGGVAATEAEERQPRSAAAARLAMRDRAMTHRQKHKGKKRPRSWHHRWAGPDRALRKALRLLDAALERNRTEDA